MRNPFSIGAFLFLAVLTSVSGGITVDPQLAPDAAATVNGQPIPFHLVEVFLKNDREALAAGIKTDEERKHLDELPRTILDELIDRALIAQAVRARGIAPTEASLDADEQHLIQFCGNEARYDLYTAQNGFNRQEYRDNVLRPAANGRALIASLTRDLTVSDDEVKAAYDAHPSDAEFQRPAQVTGRHILINAQPGVLASQLEQAQGLKPGTPEMDAAVARETERRRQLAESVRAEVATPGADFAALARKYSEDPGTRVQGGSLGTFAHGVHPAALDDAFFALQPGQIGPVVRTDFGFHVVEITARTPAGRKTLTEAAPEIRHELLQEKSARVLQVWLVGARAKAAVVVRAAHALPDAR